MDIKLTSSIKLCENGAIVKHYKNLINLYKIDCNYIEQCLLIKYIKILRDYNSLTWNQSHKLSLMVDHVKFIKFNIRKARKVIK